MILMPIERDALFTFTSKLVAALALANPAYDVSLDEACFQVGISDENTENIKAILKRLYKEPGQIPTDQKGNDSEDWTLNLLKTVISQIATGKELTEQKRRLQNCLNGMPAVLYYALTTKFAGMPSEQKIRTGDTKDKPPANTNDPKQVEQALTYLRRPKRQDYIKYGATDALSRFTTHEYDALKKTGIYILADVENLTNEQMLQLDLPANERVDLIYKLYQIKYGTKGQTS